MLSAENIQYEIKKKPILQGVSFDVKPGEFIAIIGPNGAGKSTLLKILCGELHRYTGKVLLNGQELASIKPKQLALHRAVLSQEIALTLPFKVSEVVMMGRYPHFDTNPVAEDHTIVDECLELTGMKAFKDRNYLTLSGGEKQRVHLSRVLAQLGGTQSSEDSSKLLFLDEPVNGLDLKYQQLGMKIAREWKGANNAVVAVLHDLNLAAHFADRILLLNRGNQVILDTPEKVLTKENIKNVYDVEVSVRKESSDKLHVTPVLQQEEGRRNIVSIML